MKEFLQYILNLIVDHPENIEITENELSENSVSYQISVHKDDMGKVIGREGKIIQALRNVIKILAVKQGKQVRIEIADNLTQVM